LPQPTLSPGLILVPRCRTMIEPPGTSWPPKTFTPSRCALESRPFLELPKPFLCAILHLRQNLLDLHFGEGLAVSDRLLVLLLALELEHQHLVPAAVAHDRGLYRAAFHQLPAVLERGLDGQFHFGANIPGELFHPDHLAWRDDVLLSAGFNNRIHA